MNNLIADIEQTKRAKVHGPTPCLWLKFDKLLREAGWNLENIHNHEKISDLYGRISAFVREVDGEENDQLIADVMARYFDYTAKDIQAEEIGPSLGVIGKVIAKGVVIGYIHHFKDGSTRTFYTNVKELR